MSLLDNSNSARPVGGLGIGPREDYRPPATYRRGMETSAPADLQSADLQSADLRSAGPAVCKSASISTEARSCCREADTGLPVGNPVTNHTGNTGKKSQAARVMDAVRSGARDTTEIARSAGLDRTDTVKTISALVKKKMLLDLPHPPGTDRCVMLGVSAGFPVESPVSGASPDALPQTPTAPCDIHEKDEKGEKGEKGEKADEWNHWSDQDAPGSIEPEDVMPLPYASVEQGESGESFLLEEMDRMIARHQKDMNIMAALVGRLRRIHEADSEEQGEQGAMAELIRVRKALRDLIA